MSKSLAETLDGDFVEEDEEEPQRGAHHDARHYRRRDDVRPAGREMARNIEIFCGKEGQRRAISDGHFSFLELAVAPFSIL